MTKQTTHCKKKKPYFHTTSAAAAIKTTRALTLDREGLSRTSDTVGEQADIESIECGQAKRTHFIKDNFLRVIRTEHAIECERLSLARIIRVLASDCHLISLRHCLAFTLINKLSDATSDSKSYNVRINDKSIQSQQ
jgi:hypothetical protein